MVFSVCLPLWLLVRDVFVSGKEGVKVKRACRLLLGSYQYSADKGLSVVMILTQGVGYLCPSIKLSILYLSEYKTEALVPLT